MGGMFAALVLVFLLAVGCRFIVARRDQALDLRPLGACLQEARSRAKNRFLHAMKDNQSIPRAIPIWC
jgi:hypothetical protein